MKKIISKIFILVVIFLNVSSLNLLAYTDELFEIDLPITYSHSKNQNVHTFLDTEKENFKMTIFVFEEHGIKQSIWNIGDAFINEYLKKINLNGIIIESDKKTHLGYEKAVKIIVQKEVGFEEAYILESDNYIYVATFNGTEKIDFYDKNYQAIKSSFKLVDRTTEPVTILIIVIIAIIVIKILYNYRPRINNGHLYNNKKIDYKNMTDEDFKRIKEKGNF